MKYKGFEVLTHEELTVYGKQFNAIALKPKDGYIDIHIVSEKYSNDLSNTLTLQEPEENAKDITKHSLIAMIFSHIIWDTLYDRDEELWSVTNLVIESEDY